MCSVVVLNLQFCCASVWNTSDTHDGAWVWHGRAVVPGFRHTLHTPLNHSSYNGTAQEGRDKHEPVLMIRTPYQIDFHRSVGSIFYSKNKFCISGCGQLCELAALWWHNEAADQWLINGIFLQKYGSLLLRSSQDMSIFAKSFPPGIWVNIWDWFTCETWKHESI